MRRLDYHGLDVQRSLQQRTRFPSSEEDRQGHRAIWQILALPHPYPS